MAPLQTRLKFRAERRERVGGHPGQAISDYAGRELRRMNLCIEIYELICSGSLARTERNSLERYMNRVGDGSEINFQDLELDETLHARAHAR
jgi:hypothetical protein